MRALDGLQAHSSNLNAKQDHKSTSITSLSVTIPTTCHPKQRRRRHQHTLHCIRFQHRNQSMGKPFSSTHTSTV